MDNKDIKERKLSRIILISLISIFLVCMVIFLITEVNKKNKSNEEMNEYIESWHNSDEYKNIQEANERAEIFTNQIKENIENLDSYEQQIRAYDSSVSEIKQIINSIFGNSDTLIITEQNESKIKEEIDRINQINLPGLHIEYNEKTKSINYTKSELLSILNDY